MMSSKYTFTQLCIRITRKEIFKPKKKKKVEEAEERYFFCSFVCYCICRHMPRTN